MHKKHFWAAVWQGSRVYGTRCEIYGQLSGLVSQPDWHGRPDSTHPYTQTCRPGHRATTGPLWAVWYPSLTDMDGLIAPTPIHLDLAARPLVHYRKPTITTQKYETQTFIYLSIYLYINHSFLNILPICCRLNKMNTFYLSVMSTLWVKKMTGYIKHQIKSWILYKYSFIL